jgi:hypothetical protein
MSAIVELIEDTAGNIADLVDDTVGNLVDLVEDTVGNVVDLVEDTVGNVVDVITDVADWVFDEIIDPVVSTVGDIIQYALDNPIEALATLAVTIGAPYLAPFLGTTTAAITGAAKWVIPLASGTQTLVNGGSLEDAIKSAAISFAGTYAAGAVSKAVSPTINQATQAALGSTRLSTTVASVLNTSTTAAAKTFVATGGDAKAALKSFTNAAVMGGVQGGLEAATDTIMGSIEQSFKDSDFGKSVNSLSKGVKESIYAGIAAELTGQDLSEQAIFAALDSDGFVSDIVGRYAPVAKFMDGLVTDAKEWLGKDLSETQIKILTDAVGASWSIAKAGNPDLAGEAFFGSMQKPAYEALIDTLSDPIDKALDSITGASKKAELAAAPLNEALLKTSEATAGYNALQKELADDLKTNEALKTTYNAAVNAYNQNKTEATKAALESAATALTNHSEAFNASYPATKAKMDAHEATYNKYFPTIDTLQAAYDKASTYVMQDIEDLDATLKPLLSGVDRVIATTLRPGINEDSYRKLNGLAADVDVYTHYLANQKKAQVFDPADMGAEYSYDASTNKYYLKTPDGKQEIDPYVETVRGGRGEDPRLFGDYNMEDIRKTFSQPVEILSRITYDMAQLLATDTMDAKSLQGGVILPEHFKTLKDAGYNIVPYTDPVLKKVVDGTKEYSVMQTEYKDYVKRIGDEDLAMSGTVYDPEYGVMSQPVSYTGKTITYNGTTPITAETQKILKEFHGYTNEQAAKYYPIGSMVNEAPSADLVAEFEAAGYSPPDYDVLMSISKSGVGLPGSAENFVQNSIGITIDKLGQLATTFSYAKLLTNNLEWTEGAIEDTWLNKLGTSMSQIGQDFETDDYRLGVETLNANMSKAMAEAEGVGGTIKAIWGAASNAPGTFITEYILGEIIQELPPLLASGGSSLLVSGAFKIAGKQLIGSLATRAGVALGVGAVSDLAEAYGGAAQSAYDSAYSTYMSVQTNVLLGQGFSKEEATQKTSGAAKKYATDLANSAGNIGAVMGLISMGVGGLALEKAIFGTKKAPEGFAASMEALYKKSGLNEFVALGGVVVKEGVAEAIEETVVNDFIEGRLSLIDQDRSRTESNTAAALLAFIAGGTTAGAIYTGGRVAGIIESTGNSVANVQLLSNPDVTELITNPPVSTSNATSSELLTSALKTYGIDNVDTIDSLTNTALGTAYTSKQEVKDAIKLANPTITFSDSFIADATKALGGEKSDSDLNRLLETYINPRYITREEVKKAAAEEGITLTDEQAGEYEGEGDQDTVLDEVIADADPLATTQEEARQFFNDLGFTPTDEQVAQFVGAKTEEEQKAAIAKFVDPLYTDSGEAKALLTELGYNPTDEEVTKFVGQVAENKSKTLVSDYVDPRQVTDAEARKFFTDQGYEPTDAEVAARVGQITEVAAKEDVGAYINPRQTTEAEVRQTFADQGYEPTDAEVAARVGQGGDTFEADTKAGVEPYVNPRQTTEAEARKFFADQGYEPTDAEVADRVGQGGDTFETDTKAGVEPYVNPRQTTEAEVRQAFADQGYEPTDAEVADRVGQGGDTFETDTKAGVEPYVNPRQVTEEEARQYFTDLGYTPTDEQVAKFVAQVEEKTQQGVISKYVDPRQVTRAELEAIAAEEGLTLTDVLADAYVGQSEAENFAADTLDTARKEYDPLATTLSEAEAFFASTGYTATPAEIATFVASKAEDVQTSAIGAYVDPRQVTAAEAEEFLSSIGYNPTAEEIAQFTGQLNNDTYQVTQKTAIDKYVDPRYVDAGEVRAAYEKLGLVDVTQEDIDRFVGQYMEKDQLDAIREYVPTATFNVIKSLMGSPSIADNPDTDADESKDATGIYKLIEDSENAGATRDEALQAGIDALGDKLGLTRDELLAEIGLTKEELTTKIDTVSEDVAGVTKDVAGLTEDVAGLDTKIGDLGTDLTKLIEDNAGDVDAALKALSDDLGTTEEALLEALGTTKDALSKEFTEGLSAVGDILGTPGVADDPSTEADETQDATGLFGAIGETETKLTDKITGLEKTLGTDIQTVADFVGKPAREVTQADIDFVIDLIAQENVSAELIAQYDVTGDGIVDINDQTMLETALQGGDVTLAATSMFDPATGLYLQQEQDTQALLDEQARIAEELRIQQELDTQTVLDQNTELNTQLNTQINTNAQQKSLRDFLEAKQSGAFDGGGYTATTPDPIGEITPYDWQTIFRDQEQAGRYANPYGPTRATPATPANLSTRPLPSAAGFAAGGQVEDINAMLLKLLGDT